MRIVVAEPETFTRFLQARYQLESLPAVTGVTTDSREVQPGDFYIPIVGQNANGHAFAPAAAAQGASLIMASETLPSLPSATALAEVDDTVKALGELARAWRSNYSIPVAAITGSNGKTTTKNLAAKMLGQGARLLHTGRSYNSTVGLPMTLLQLGSGHDRVLLEMGTNQPGEIAALAGIAQPTLGLVTNISASHIEYLGDEDGVAREKANLFKSLPEDGVAVTNLGDRRVAAMESPAIRFTYELLTESTAHSDADVRGWQELSDDGPWLQFSRPEMKIRLPQFGEVWAQNALAATALALAFDTTEAAIREAIEDYQLPPGRGRICHFGQHTVIDDTWNANPASMLAALGNLAAVPGYGYRVAVLADMLELGAAAAGYHSAIGTFAAEAGIDLLLCYGNESQATADAATRGGLEAQHFDEQADLVAALRDHLRPGDIILVKGSRGMVMETVITDLFGEASC